MSIDIKVLKELEDKLLEEKKKLENELSRFAKPTLIPGDYETRFEDIGRDEDDNVSEVEQYSDNLALENTLEKELKKVDDALKRIGSGTYGICQNCGQEIDIERLKAYPAAQNCIKCKKKMTAVK
jgi:DnaK suppressor protein